MMKPKTNRKGLKGASSKYDRCQTPFYAVDPILPYLKADWLIWESAAGEDRHIVKKLTSEGFDVHGTDILDGYNFFCYEPVFWDIQITNPPYSIKYAWLERTRQLGKPFALLLPWETWATQTGAYWLDNCGGVEVIKLPQRINFKMPNRGYGGSGAQFPVAWFTWGLNIGHQVINAEINIYEDEQLSLLPPALGQPERVES